jgi:hypothetical protein
MKLFVSGAALAALLVSGTLAAQTPVVPQRAGDAAERVITLTGCVVKGDDGYVLSDATEQMPRGTTTPAYERSAPDPLSSRLLYWLDDDDELEEHAGKRVEVSGKAKGRLEKGEIEVDRKDAGVELEFEADGKKVKVLVPNTDVAVGTDGALRNVRDEYNVVVLKVDVKSVKRVADACR